jgi:hypothetical protein
MATGGKTSKAQVPDPPVEEKGWVFDPALRTKSPNLGNLAWGIWDHDEAETSPELQWPHSVKTYDMMRNDAQCWGLYLGATSPILRYVWFLDPNECPKRLCKMLAADLNLPVGKEAALESLAGIHVGARLRAQRRFSWNKHLQLACLALLYGHMYFEQVGDIDEEGYWRLRKLAPRHPRTIQEFAVAPDGGLVYIKQNESLEVPPLPVDHLVGYVFQQEPGNWVGRSIFRPMYRNYLIKDRLLRVDAIKHERNGVGMPIVEAPPDATDGQIKALDQMAQEFKAGERGGGAVPHGTKFTLQGTIGTIPETITSIRFQNEEMARSMLMMFMQLGQTETGSRALAGEFIDWFKVAQEVVANWLRDTSTEHIVEDWWDWNVDPNAERTPLIAYLKDDDPEVRAALGEQVIEEPGAGPTTKPEEDDPIIDRTGE